MILNDKTKKVDFSPSEKILLDKIFDEMRYAIASVMTKYKDNEDAHILVIAALTTLTKHLNKVYKSLEIEADKMLKEKEAGR